MYEKLKLNDYNIDPNSYEICQYHENGNLAYRVRRNGNHQSSSMNGLPAIEQFDENGQLSKEVWCKENEIYRENDLPAIKKYKNNQLFAEEWHKGPLLHRNNNKPAIIFYENGQAISQQFYTHGRCTAEESLKNKTLIDAA